MHAHRLDGDHRASVEREDGLNILLVLLLEAAHRRHRHDPGWYAILPEDLGRFDTLVDFTAGGDKSDLGFVIFDDNISATLHFHSIRTLLQGNGAAIEAKHRRAFVVDGHEPRTYSFFGIAGTDVKKIRHRSPQVDQLNWLWVVSIKPSRRRPGAD
jgi:hypothetical protein